MTTFPSDPKNGLPLAAGSSPSESWELLANCVERFIAAWENGGSPPDFDLYLSELPDPLRSLVLVELIKVDLEYRYQPARRELVKFRLEDYLARYPCFRADAVPADLIFEEYHVRKSAGESVSPQEYLERFPRQQSGIRRLLAIDSHVSGSTVSGRRAAEGLCVGDELDDFTLLAHLGKGAFAAVFLARQKSMQRLVALKISRDRGSEPQTLAQLDHPHIVRIFDQRKIPERNERLMYMQYVGGDTLEAIIRRAREVPIHDRTGKLVVDVVQEGLDRGGGFLSMDASTRARVAAMDWMHVVCEFGTQIATALDYAHAHGVLHRDVKPANVLVGADGGAKLADFNISFSSHVGGIVAAAYFGGSLAYMSPEQLEASNPEHPRQPDELDGRADLYSLGVLLCELLTGERPFGVEEFAGSWSETLEDMTRRRQECLVPSKVPAECRRLWDILTRCLAPARERRYATGEELARELRLCMHPDAAELLDVDGSATRSFLASHALYGVLLAALIPNALAGVFNFFYNDDAIVKYVQHSKNAFLLTQFVINGTAFPLGLLLVAWWTRPVAACLARSETADARTDAAQRLFRLGDRIAVLGIVEWTIAGLAYPISLHLLAGGIGISVYAHFWASLLLCGLIAAAYPFFLVGFLATRVYFPTLYARRRARTADVPEMEAMVRRAAGYLFIAGGVPAMAVALLVTGGLWDESPNTFALLVLSLLGAVGFGVVVLIYRAMQRDSALLSEANRP